MLFIENIKWWWIFRKVSKALGFRLFSWQEEYIRDTTYRYPATRNSGRTTAHILRMLLNSDIQEISISPPIGQRLWFSDHKERLTFEEKCIPIHEYQIYYETEFFKIFNRLVLLKATKVEAVN